MKELINRVSALKRPPLYFLIAAAVVWTVPAKSCRAAVGEYTVGVAKIDITPNYPVRLHGFGGRREESEGITQPIWAKALAIGSDEEKPVIVFTVDNLGMRMSIVDEVAARLRQKAGIERSRIALTFTHSHTTPKTTGSADTIFSSPIPQDHQQRIDRYTAELTDALERVALDALADRKPAQIAWAVGKVGFAKNRRTEGGPVDHDLPMLVVKSPAGEIRAIYVTYACHCVTLSDNKISGDWAGYAQEAIERHHPGAVALVSIGCGSDSNPDSGVTGSNIAAAAEQGGQIASEVDRLLRGPLKPITGRITTQLHNIGLPFSDLPTRQELDQLATQDTPAGYNAKFQLAKLERGEALQTAIDYPIQTFVFGDSLAMVFLGGEVCVDYSIRLKQELDADKVWLHGYSNDFCCYIPSERLVREGGYGGGAETVYFALPATLKAGLEDKIIAEVRRQLPRRFVNSEHEEKTSVFEPSSPADALAAINTHDDLVVELVAAEPLVASPVAIDFGPDGRLYVAEMTDYGRGAEERFQQSGSVKVLTDREQDGRFDQATTLQTGLRFPTDVKVWRNGVIVCDAPDVIYLEDTDGDGDADIRKTLLTGFATHNAQARVNSLRWGLDNWLYGSCGLFGGRIRSSNGTELELGASDFRFRPDTGEIEAVTGKTQQGRVRDDWGNWFGCENGSLCDHYPLSNHYLARNPHVVPPATEVPVLAGDDPHRLFPAGQLVLFELSGAPGRPTAACGLEIYRDHLLGSELFGNALVAEPVNQLLHRRVLERRGATFTGHRAANETNREFLASTDHWFRPVQIRTGLDGCLWIVDMCRYVIEHPRFIPQETLQALDPMAGRGAGRIYRVRPRNTPPREVPRLDQPDAAGVVAALSSANGPQRDLAQQLLVERGDTSAVPALEQMVTGAGLAQSRLQALCTLEGLACLRPEIVLAALRDAHPAVRSHAIRLCEPFLRDSTTIHEAVLALVDDDDPQVQLQLAYTLGESRDAKAYTALGDLAWKHHGDRYLSAAILSSVSPENAQGVLQSILSRGKLQDLPAAIGEAVILIATKLGDDTCRDMVLTALSQAPDGGPSTPQLEVSAGVLEGASAPRRQHEPAEAAKLSPAVETVAKLARRVAENPGIDDRKLLAAIRIMACTATDDVELSRQLAGMLGPQRSPEVQQAAVKLAAGLSPAVAGELLLTNWGRYSPAVRAQVIDVFFSRDELLPILLQAVASEVVKPATFDTFQRERLLKHETAAIREAAKSAFQGGINPDRKKVLESYATAARAPGNGTHGRELFQKLCDGCHRLEDHGFSVGPDLAALSSRTATSLLESILDPNRAIDERYQSYLAVTDEGRSFAGILTQETANSVTLVEQQGKEHTMLRNSLEELVNTGQSLMPEGYEKDLSPGEVADLLAYLASCGTPPKSVPGNQAELIQSPGSGPIWLLAANCEIHGQEITFEKPFENIGMWHSETDHIAWNVAATKEQAYNVYLEWACTEESAGSQFVLEGLAEPVQFTVPSTRGWSSYRTQRIGRTMLPAGNNRIIARAGGKLVGPALLDLRGVYLVPAPEGVQTPVTGSNEQIPTPVDAATAIAKLLESLAIGTPQEYERIPAIWKHAVEVGKRNDTSELQRLLLLALPEINESLAHWQVVVVGGGIVNGLTMNGTWPGHRIHELLAGNKPLLARWERIVTLSAAMADDESVPPGTRYDALRILGTQSFDSSGKRLMKYLDSKTVDLQMGAVSGLGDIDDTRSAAALLSKLSEYAPVNRELAIDALLRTDARREALLEALESTPVSIKLLTEEQRRKLVELKKE